MASFATTQRFDMKKLALILTGFSFVVSNLWAGDVPRGTVLELHSCELYAGGCVVSSQATLDGRYMLRAWSFNDGAFSGEKFSGLCVALVQSSSENLAAESALPGSAMVYLPQQATSAQRESLLGWLKATLPDLKRTSFKTRVVPLHFARTGAGYAFAAGESISLTVAPLESCETGACGEALWYTPRAPTSLFTVALNRSSRISEPSLQLKWNDAGQRSVFLGKFGEDSSAQNQFVTSADFCSPTGKLF